MVIRNLRLWWLARTWEVLVKNSAWWPRNRNPALVIMRILWLWAFGI